ncbi:hypoxanthine-guanine phosphoribosyltransferase [Methyloversatilis thermotolerans]|uniref:hypoxanthine-guanine phosphoribosyltransferase n=1 Tax=Methyloversatilis thermotolerans TaxID=1346290 RepID=UPI000360B790|nr:hypoxanthine-guanine phosphoribosyltransferase [Methyloversatilis thermotolerans]
MSQVAQARALLDQSDLVCDADEVQAAVDRLACDITAQLGDSYPLLLTVMGGAVVFAGQLLTRLPFPLDVDYLHVTRYGDATAGGELRWISEPRTPLAGRTVLVMDDILDEGITLAAIRQHVLSKGAARCLTAVFADKRIGRDKPIQADFTGLALPDRYVFGFGMDVRGAWRNLPSIHALKE